MVSCGQTNVRTWKESSMAEDRSEKAYQLGKDYEHTYGG
jgi:hypothetical protein